MSNGTPKTFQPQPVTLLLPLPNKLVDAKYKFWGEVTVAMFIREGGREVVARIGAELYLQDGPSDAIARLSFTGSVGTDPDDVLIRIDTDPQSDAAAVADIGISGKDAGQASFARHKIIDNVVFARPRKKLRSWFMDVTVSFKKLDVTAQPRN